MSKHRTAEPPLSPDLEQSFFRPWAQRSSEQEYSSGTPSSSTTPLSPKTFPRRNLKRPADKRGISETSQHPYDRQVALAPSVLAEFASSKLARSLDAERLRHRRSSTFSERTRRLLKISTSRRSSSITLESEPPTSARQGFTWKRKISGRWLEVRVGHKSQSEVLEPRSEEAMPAFPSAAFVPDPFEAIDATEKKDFAPLGPANHADRSAFPEAVRKVSLYERTKRRLYLKSSSDELGIEPGSDEPDQNQRRTNTFTTELLRRASTILREFAGKQRTTPSPSTTGSSQSIAVWHNRGSRLLPFHHSKGHSSSSSVRNLKMGQPPQPSPSPEAMYTGSDNKQYFRVELSAPGGPTYLPSEARRINTPPLPNKDRPLRGFFFDYNSPPDKPFSDLCSLETKPHRTQLTSGENCYRVEQVARELDERHDQFELNVPDHLPSSPLCPKNPKHRSGGKGVCVHHGRNRSISLEDREDLVTTTLDAILRDI